MLHKGDLKSKSNTTSPFDGSTVTSELPSVLNGVYGMSSILLVSSPPDNLKKHLIDEVDPVIGQNGTGVWAIKAALDLGVGIPSIYEAVSTRSNSKNFKLRKNLIFFSFF